MYNPTPRTNHTEVLAYECSRR